MKLSKPILIIFVLGLIGAGLWQRQRSATPTTASVPSASSASVMPQELLTNEIWTVEQRTLTQTLPITGTLRALNQATIKAKIAGDLRDVLVREGDNVSAGQVLAHIDPIETQARNEQNEAALLQAQTQVDIARRTHQNNIALAEKGFISSTALDNSLNQLKAAQAGVESARAAGAITRKNMADSVVRAPITGQIAERLVQPGERVPLDAKLLTIVDPKQLEVEASISADRIGDVHLGQKVTLTPEDSHLVLNGEIARINPATVSGSRSVPVYIRLHDAQKTRAGVFAQGNIILEEYVGQQVIPVSALRGTQQLNTSTGEVLVIQQGRLNIRSVELGPRTHQGMDALVVVQRGLNVGDQIIRQNPDSLRVGANVVIREASATQPNPR